MASTTTNLALTKPAGGESYNVDTWNTNMQKIDDFAGECKNAQLGSAATVSALATILDSALVAMPSNGVKAFQINFTAVDSPFTQATYICTLYKTTTNTTNSHAIFRRVDQPVVVSGARNTNGWSFSELAVCRKAITYYSLIDRVQISKTATDYNFYGGRSLATYPTISIQPIIGGYFRQGLVIPRNHFNNAIVGKFSLTYPSGGENVEIVLNYVSDTKINMKYNATGTFTVEMIIDGLANG